MLEFLEQSTGARNRVGVGLSYPSHGRTGLLGYIGWRNSLESIPGLFKSLKIPSQICQAFYGRCETSLRGGGGLPSATEGIKCILEDQAFPP